MQHGHIEPRRGKHGTSYRATLFLGIDPATGKPDRLRETFDTEREAEEALARWKVAHLDGRLVRPSRQSVAEYLHHWLTVSKRGRIEGTTQDSYAQMIRTHIDPVLGHLPLQDLRAPTIERFLADKLESGRLDGKGGLSERMVDYLYTILKAALAHAERQRLVPANEAALVERPRRRHRARKELTIWTPEEVAAFLATATADDRHPLWLLTLVGGLRREEVLGLRWRDLDLRQGTMRIAQAVVARRHRPEGRLEVKDTKNSSSYRTLVLDADTAAELAAHRARQAAQRLRVGPLWEDLDLVFCTAKGTPLDPDNVSHACSRLVAAAGVRRVTLHGLRHLAASYGLAHVGDVVGVSRFLGHSRPSTTTDRYGGLLPGADRRVSAGIASVIYGQRGGGEGRTGT